MTANHEPSVEELRRESERTRAALTTTVSDLREKVSETAADLKTRISPAHIKEELKDYVREGSDNLVQSIERRVRDNPLQAVAIGAALAYPLWSIVRAIPAPITLVGAGLWFAGKNGKSSAAKGKAEAGEVSASATARVSDLAASAQTAAGPAVRRVADVISDAGAALSSGAATVSDKTMAAAHDVRDSLAGMGHTVVDSLTKTAGNATAAVSETASAVKDRAVQAAEQSRNVFVDMVDRNPLLVAGAGLAIGAFIAASFPASDAENRLFGERSDDLKDKALDAASQGVQRAKDIAADVVGEVASAAASEGLNVDGIKKAVDGLTESVKAVADRGIQSALGGDTSPESQVSSQSYKS